MRFFLLAGTLAAYIDNKSNDKLTTNFAIDLASGKATRIGSMGEGRGLWRMVIAP